MAVGRKKASEQTFLVEPCEWYRSSMTVIVCVGVVFTLSVLCYSNAIAGESALDRLCCGLGGKTMLPHIITNIPPMLANCEYSVISKPTNYLGLTLKYIVL